MGGVDRQAAPAKIRHGCHLGVAEKPEQRTIGVDTQHFPADAVGQPRQQGPTQTDRRAAAQTLRFPADPVADGDVDTLIRVIALLVGNIGDQFLVDTTPDIGQVDGVHGERPLSDLTSGAAQSHFNPLQAAVDRDVMAGGEAGILACQERHRPGHLVGADQAPHRLGRAELMHFVAVNCSVDLRSPTVAGETRFAVIPCGASSSAMYRTNWSIAALAVPSVIMPLRGRRDNTVVR